MKPDLATDGLRVEVRICTNWPAAEFSGFRVHAPGKRPHLGGTQTKPRRSGASETTAGNDQATSFCLPRRAASTEQRVVQSTHPWAIGPTRAGPFMMEF